MGPTKREALKDSPQVEELGQVSWAAESDPTALLPCPRGSSTNPHLLCCEGKRGPQHPSQWALGTAVLNR